MKVDVTNEMLLKTIQEIIDNATANPARVEIIEIKKMIDTETKDININLHVTRLDSGEENFSLKTGDTFNLSVN